MKLKNFVFVFCSVISLLLLANTASALRGTETTFKGDLGTVEVGYVSDSPNLTGYLDENCSLFVHNRLYRVKRIQYDMWNTSAYGIKSFRIVLSLAVKLSGYTNRSGFLIHLQCHLFMFQREGLLTRRALMDPVPIIAVIVHGK